MKKLILTITLFIGILSIVFLPKTIIKADDSLIELYITVNDQRTFTKSDLESQLVYDAYLYFDLWAVSTTSNDQKLTNFDFTIENNDFFTEIFAVEAENYTRWTPVMPPTPVKWSIDATGAMGLRGTTSQGDDARITSVPSKVGQFMFAYNNDVEISDLQINASFNAAQYDNNASSYTAADVIFSPIIIGNPNATPNAKLSGAVVEGSGETHNVTFAESNQASITLTYQDSLSKLIVTPLFEKNGATAEIKVYDNNDDEKSISGPFVDGDYILITTQDESETEEYRINITVTPVSTDNNIELKYTTSTATNVNVGINSDGAYEVTVPYSITSITINATPADTLATIIGSSSIANNNLSVGKNIIGPFTVKAEDGDEKSYSVIVIREEGSSDTDFSYSYEFSDADESDRIENISLTSDNTTNSHDLSFTTKYIGFRLHKKLTFQKIEYNYDGGSTYSSPVGTNYIQIPNITFGTSYNVYVRITSENGSITIYTISFKVAPTNDTSLNNNSVRIKEGTRSPVPTTNLTYTLLDADGDIEIELNPHTYQEIRFSDGTYSLATAKKTISRDSLTSRENYINFFVKAQDGTEKEYTITIIKKSHDVSITNLVFSNSSGSSTHAIFGDFIKTSENTYTYIFSHGQIETLNNLKLVVTSAEGSKITSASGNTREFNLDFTSTPSNFDEKEQVNTFTVTSESGLFDKEYTIIIKKEKASQDIEIDSITIDNILFSEFNNDTINRVYDKFVLTPSGDETFKEIYVSVILANGSIGTAKLTIDNETSISPGNFGKTITINRAVMRNLVIKVVAEDTRHSNTITIPIYYGTDDSTLRDITLEGTSYIFDKDVDSKSITIPYSFGANVTVNAIPSSGYSKVMINGVVRESGSTVIPINSSTGSTTTITVRAVSEVGTLGDEYTIIVTRDTALTYNYLENLRITKKNGEEVDFDFTANETNYEIRIDDLAAFWPIEISANVEVSHRSYINTINTTSITETINPNSGSRITHVINVYSEGYIRNTYTLEILRANDIKEFEYVTISGNGFPTTIINHSDFNNREYNLGSVNYSTDKLDVTFTMIGNSKSEIVSGSSFIGNNLSGSWNLSKTGSATPNEGVFTVKSQAGNESLNYTIKITRDNPLTTAALDKLEVLVNGSDILDVVKPSTGYADIYYLRVDRDINSVTVNASVLTSDRSTVTSFNLVNSDATHKNYTSNFTINEGAYRDISIEVLAEDGATKKTHTIRIYRKNSNIDIDSIVLSIDGTIIYSGNSIDDAITALSLREIVYTDNTLTITITPNDINSKIYFNGGTRIIPSGQGEVIHTINLTSGENRTIKMLIESEIALNEIAADYKKQEYTFTYTKNVASDVAELESLKFTINGVDVLADIFESSITIYGEDPNHIIVGRGALQVSITAVAKDNGRVISGLGNKNLTNNENSFIITVRSESTQFEQDYTVYLYRNNNSDEINEIKVDNDSITFDETFNYFIGDFEYSKETISLNVILADQQFAKYYVNGTLGLTSVNLEYGSNKTIEIYAVSDFEYNKNGLLAKKGQHYVLTYNRAYPYENTEIDFTLKNEDTVLLKSETSKYVYTYTLPDTSTIETLDLFIALKDSRQSISGLVLGLNKIDLIRETDLSIDQTIIFTVLAENNKSQVYEIRITKGVPMSDNFDIDDITITDNLNKPYSYTIEDELGIKVINLGKVLYEVNKLTLNILKADEKASLNIANPYVRDLVVGENTIIFTITSEDGNGSQTYHILIERGDANDDVNLKEIKIIDVNNPGTNLVGLLNISSRGVTFVPSDHENEIIYLDESYIGKVLNLEFVKEFKNQSVTISNSSITLKVGTDNTFIINVVAENGDSRTYNFTFHVLYETNDLVSLKLNDDLIDLENLPKYETKIENIVVVPTLEEKFGSYKVFIDGIEITGATKQFTLNIGDVRTLEIFVYTQSDNLDPVKIYDIEVERIPLSTNNKLDEIRFLDPLNPGVFLFGLESRNPTHGIFDSNTYTYTVELGLEYLNKVISLVTVNGDEFQTVILNPTSKTLVRGENVFNITVQAENKNPEEVVVISYTIKVMVKNTENNLTKLTINGETINLSEMPIEFTTENETANIVPTMANNDGSFVLKDGNGNVITSPYNLSLGNNEIVIEVLNEYGDVVEEYEVNIVRNKVSDTSFNDLKIVGSDNTNYLVGFDKDTHEYNIEIPQNVNFVTLSANIHSKATAIGIGRHDIDLNETITITFQVTAENDDQSLEYTFNITRRALSTNNKLNEIRIIDTINAGNYLLGLIDRSPELLFDPEKTNYTINLGLEYLNGNNRNLIIRFVKGDDYQTVDKTSPHTLILEKGKNVVTFQATAEDKNNVLPTIYTITINVLNKENDLNKLTINGETINLSEMPIEFTTENETANIVPTLVDSNGSFILKDGNGNVITSPYNLSLGDNEIVIEVLNEYGDVVEEYEVNIVRNKVSDTSFNDLKIVGSDNTNYLVGFNKDILEYDIEIPQNVNFVTLSANIHAKATAIGIGRHDIDLNETITITFQVTAENDDQSLEYTFSITRRALSTNNKLNEISIVDPMDPTSYLLGLDAKNPLVIFDPNTRNYTINLGLEYLNILYRDLTLRYEKGDNYQVIDKNSPIPIRLTRDKNEVIITVIAEDSNNTTPFIYTITINVLNANNSLEELNINNELVTIPSDNIILFETESEQANITYKPENNDGKVIIKDENGKILTNLIDLDMGKNIVIIEVENEFGDVVNEYEIIITRNADSDTSLHAELIGNDDIDYLSFDDKTLVYYVTVPFEVSEVSLNITNNPKAISTGEQTVSLASGIETYLEFFVTAENGDVSDTYKIYVTREFNTEDKLSSLTIETDKEELLSSINFNKENNYYYFQVNEQHTYVIFMHQANYGQTVTGVLFDEQISLNHGLNTYEIIVQPHDLTLSPFVITIEIEMINSSVEIEEILVDNKDIYEEGKTNYILDAVSSDINEIELIVNPKDNNADVVITVEGKVITDGLIKLVPGQNEVIVTITSEDGTNVEEYTITIEQLLETYDLLDELIIKTNKETYLLGLEDKEPEDLFNAETFTYSITVNETVEFIKMNYVLGSQKQTIIGDFDVELNINHGLNTFIVEVYPEDPTLEGNIYKIEITKVYENIDLETLLVDGEDIYIENTTSYELDNLTTDTKSIMVIPTLTNEYGKYEIKDNNGNVITNNEVPVYFGNNKITITLTSEDGSVTKEYTINFEQVLSSNNEVIDLEVIDLSNNVNKIIFDNNTLTYDVKFNYSSENTRIRITTNDKAKVYINELYKANAREDFILIPGESRLITVYIEAEDGTKGEIYKVNIYRMTEDEGRMSDNNKLRDLKLEIPLDEIPFNFEQNKLEYTIRVPYTAEEIYLKGYPEHHGATVHNEGAYRLEVGSNDPIYIRVQAEDGTPSRIQYKVTFVREEPNTDTSLKDLVVKDLNGNVLEFDNNVKFDSDNRIYTITLDKESYINQVRIDTVLNNQTQSIFGNGVVSLHGEIEGQYNTVLPVTVVAEDGSSEDYIIYILHDLDFSNITEIKDISIIGDDRISYFGLEFEGDIYNYDVYVPFNVLETRLIVQTLGNVIYLDNNDKEIDDNRLQQFNSDNLIVYRFKVQSMNEQNESPVYEINVIREVADSNALLETILIDGKEILDFDPLVNNYEYIQFILDPNKVDILAKPQSETSIVNGNKTYTLIEGESTFISIVVTAQDKTTNTYIVEVKYVNSNALLGELSVYELDEFGNEFQIPIQLVPGEFNYTVQISRNINIINVKGSGEDQGGARLRGFGQYRIGETDLVIPITVTSGDGKEERTYLVTITKSMRGDASLETVLINDGNGNIIYDFTAPYKVSNDTNVVTLSAKAKDGNARVYFNDEYSSNGQFNINNLEPGQTSVLIRVESEDGQTIKTYVVNLAKDYQPDLLLTILLITSLLLWIITILILIIRKNRKKKVDDNQLIF